MKRFKEVMIYWQSRERESRIEELQKRIEALEAIVNRTPQEEQELQEKKQELTELEKKNQEQNSNQKSYLPWIIGGVVIMVLVAIIIYLFSPRQGEKPIK